MLWQNIFAFSKDIFDKALPTKAFLFHVSNIAFTRLNISTAHLRWSVMPKSIIIISYIRLIIIKHLYTATYLRGAPDPGQCLHQQIGRFSGACGTDQTTYGKGLKGTEVICSSWMSTQ